MSNWWNVIKQNKLVNLPKFKVKPFNTAKPNEEDRECKDKIMKIFDFTENFQLPMMEDIVEGYDDIKIKNHTTVYINRQDEDNVKRIGISKNVEKYGVDKIPEEAFCKLLDFVQNRKYFTSDDVVIDGLAYTIFSYVNAAHKSEKSVVTYRKNTQYIGILTSDIRFVAQLNIDWDDDSVNEELLDFIKTMEWPI